MTTEQCLAYLQRKSATNGDSVFSHLAQLIQLIVVTQPENAVDILETSLLLKQTRFVPEEGPKVPRSWKDDKDEKFVKQFIGLQSACLQGLKFVLLLLFFFHSIPEKKPPPAAVDPESEEPPPEEKPEEEEGEGPEYAVDNFLSDSAFFEAIGSGLGRAENYQIVLTMRQLGGTKIVSKMKFFGKFFGINSNYFVFETTSEPAAEPEGGGEEGEEGAKKGPWGRPVETIPVEAGIGPNANTYWVCSRPGDELYRLPDVTPLQIKTARQIKKFFTGNLKAEVSAYPPFPGVEENYLRAQIARISATCEIAPKGFYKAPEEGEEGGEGGPLEPDEEYQPLATAELQSLENWVHKNKYLNLQGRTTLFVPEKEEGEEAEEEEGEEKEEQPPSPEELEEIPGALTSIDTDKDLPQQGWKPWSLITSSTHKSLKHQVLGLRSAIWPGACTVVTPAGFSSVYIGWGMKHTPFVAPLPPPVLKEFEGLTPESLELPPIPKPPEPEAGEGEEGGEGEEE
ncbi:flagellar radial spoke protein 6 [Selaginella moellendorffii]|uniref:Flagellar radial spoke protein 6 n=2 Tax=Selaginella moellendorffii TaxID=88036 RepID=D8SB00_SELML|nr:flagellar radial spoke protein 6 [Selaginella moellendorffii]